MVGGARRRRVEMGEREDDGVEGRQTCCTAALYKRGRWEDAKGAGHVMVLMAFNKIRFSALTRRGQTKTTRPYKYLASPSRRSHPSLVPTPSTSASAPTANTSTPLTHFISTNGPQARFHCRQGTRIHRVQGACKDHLRGHRQDGEEDGQGCQQLRW